MSFTKFPANAEKPFAVKKSLASLFLMSSIAGLAACGGSSDSTDSTGQFSLGVTDAPVDNATEVVVEFTGVAIKPASGEAIEFTFEEAKSINLLDLQGTLSEGLINGETVAAGEYEWIRLDVNVEQGVRDSYMMVDGSEVELNIPSGSETGLKLVSGFTVPAGGSADFTIDFDLRKSIVNQPGMPDALLKPALRIVDNTLVGSVAGIINATLVSEQCADAGVDDGAVYVYSGADATPADVQGTESDPLASALVKVGDGGEYQYEVGFLSEGSYTLAYTCDAGIDDPATADTLDFVGTVNVEVMADTETMLDF
jgi:hypothetical protein